MAETDERSAPLHVVKGVRMSLWQSTCFGVLLLSTKTWTMNVHIEFDIATGAASLGANNETDDNDAVSYTPDVPDRLIPPIFNEAAKQSNGAGWR